MQIRVKKLEAAESQLIEAISLFFEERDPVSIHTLASAAKQILLDHISKEDAEKHKLFSHRHTPIFKNDDDRKKAHNIMREAANFFKHANKDIKENKHEIEFEPLGSELDILEALDCLELLKGENYILSIPEFKIFRTWFYALQRGDAVPYWMHEQIKDTTKTQCLELINGLKTNPNYMLK